MSNRLRIAHVTATFPPYLAGTGYVAHYQTRELARRGHEVHVFTAAVKGSSDEVTADGVHVHRLRPLLQVGNASVLPALLGIRGFDLVHLHYPFMGGAELVSAICRLRRMPYVLNYHNDLVGTGTRARIFDLYTRLFSRAIFHSAQRLLAVTTDHALHCGLSPLFQRDRHRLIELNNGVDVDHFHPGWDGSILRQQLGVDQKCPVVLFVAALDAAHHFKGLRTLLQVWPHLNTDATLLVVGDGDMRAVYQAEAEQLGIAGRVHFAGKVEHGALPQYFAAADLVVLPSTPPESFGLVLIEAMACGRPVIGSRIPGVRRVVDDGRTGFLVEPANPAALAAAMERVLTMPEADRKQLGEEGRRKAVNSYSWPVIGARLESIYRSVVEDRVSLSSRPVKGTP
jgi:glycosyltransferase involved in cell wall biosynthesis